MDELVLIELFCGACRSRFFVCERDFRGHRYCQDVCRIRGQRKATKPPIRGTSDRPRGELGHGDRNRALRKRKSDAACVTDEGSEKLACVASLPTPDHLPAAMEVAAQSDGEGKNDEAIHLDSFGSAKPDAAVAVGRDRRDPKSGSATGKFPPSPTRNDDTVRGLVDVAGRQVACCCVCRRVGQFILPGIRGRSGRRGPQRVFRGRDRSADTAARAANQGRGSVP